MAETSRRAFLQYAASGSLLGAASVACGERGWGALGCDDDLGYRVTIPSMGSTIEIRWMGGDGGSERDVAETARSCVDSMVDVLSDYQQDSECMRLCRDAASGDWIEVSDLLWHTLLECDRWHRATEGAFDAALGALTRLRRSTKEFSENDWQEARARCGWEHLELHRDEHRVRFHRPGVMLDFGAIGKGMAVDRIGQHLRSMGIHRFLINASGNMLCGDSISLGRNGERDLGWPISIGVLGDRARELKRLRLAQTGIATSGEEYQRFRDGASNGEDSRSSHIVDPVRRRGLDQPHMATVITASAADADALATACCVHLQRGTIHAWMSRAGGELPRAEFVFQSWRDGAIAYTSIPCDW